MFGTFFLSNRCPVESNVESQGWEGKIRSLVRFFFLLPAKDIQTDHASAFSSPSIPFFLFFCIRRELSLNPQNDAKIRWMDEPNDSQWSR